MRVVEARKAQPKQVVAPAPEPMARRRPRPGTESSESGESSTGEPVDPPECGVGSGIARRLTNAQFEHAVADIFGVQVQADLSTDAVGTPFDSAAAIGTEDSAAISAVAIEVAAASVGTIACTDDVTPRACAQGLADQLGTLALRGQHDLDALMAGYDAAGSFDAGVESIIISIIEDPAFVMVTPTGEVDGPNLRLDGVSLATRVSLFVWNTLPDEELLDAADSLADPGVLEAQVDRMLDHPRFSRAQADLYGQMTQVDELPQVDRSAVDDAWSTALAAAMVEEQRRFVMAQAADPNATLASLLTAASTFVNADLGALYGADIVGPTPGAGWGPAQLDPQRRGGLFTQLGFVARHSANASSDVYPTPSSRGQGVIRAFGCVAAPAHPGSISAVPTVFESREDWDESVADAPCASCHVIMDPAGHAFGNYDGIGRWSETADSTAAQSDTVFGIAFDGAIELGAEVASDEDAIRCVAKQHYTFALRRTLSDEDACALEAYAEAFSDSGGNLRALVRAIAMSGSLQLARP